MNDTFYPDVNEPTDGEARLYKITEILIGLLLLLIVFFLVILYEVA